MNPIEELKTEHEAVRMSLRVLQRIATDIGHRKQLAHTEDINEIIDFFRVFMDRCHHGKEEKLLFPALEKIGVGHNGGPIGVMLSEHDQGRNYVGEMEKAIRSDGKDAAAEAQRFAKSAYAFIDLLEHHIEKENQVLFPIGENRLSGKQLERLKEGFDRIESEEVGPGRHEAFHDLLDRLQHKYLDSNVPAK